MYRSIILLIVWWPAGVLCQVFDDFSDGELSQNPTWVGNLDCFTVEHGVLRLVAEGAGTAYLATANEMMDDVRWDIWVRLAFTPSDNNHVRIYLTSSSPDLSGPLNGYYLQLGKTGGDNKRIYFYRQDGTQHELLMEGLDNVLGGNNNVVRIRVEKGVGGRWVFLLSLGDGMPYLPQGSVDDGVYETTHWFGLFCRFTASNAQRMYFDDISVGQKPPPQPPVITRLIVESAHWLRLIFSEAVQAASATNVSNYQVDNQVGHPMAVSHDASRPHEVDLLFSQDFASNVLHTLYVDRVMGVNQLPMEAWDGEFVHYVSNPFDLVFNELMVNSRPVVLLPPHDWIELYNTTHLPIDLEGWTLVVGGTERFIPHVVVEPEGYAILTTEQAQPLLSEYGQTVGIPGLGMHSLTMGGNDLVLKDKKNQVISFVTYSDRWYGDAARSGGGWSLEKIDPYNFCEGGANWRASVDARGGTPGSINSVKSENPDRMEPVLIGVESLDPDRYVLHFSEPMDYVSLGDRLHYSLEKGDQNASYAKPLLPDFSRVELGFPVSVNDAEKLHLGPLTDCAGNALVETQTLLATPETAEKHDMVINEVLFNPPQGGSRYVELINRSDKVLALSDYVLAGADTLSGELTNPQSLHESAILVFPEDILLFSTHPEAVKSTFLCNYPYGFFELPSLPRMTNSGGVAVLATKGLQTIDSVVFSDDMHFPLLVNTRGVSLERIHPNRPSSDRANWHSAASSVGFGTPGYTNSQFARRTSSGGGILELVPRVFSPDGSGHDNLLNIHYAFPDPGLVATVRIFDSEGRKIRILAEGDLLASEGVWTWDGVNDAGIRAHVGIYLVYVETLHPDGRVHYYRLAGVLTARF